MALRRRDTAGSTDEKDHANKAVRVYLVGT
jgi:hypothetical protein